MTCPTCGLPVDPLRAPAARIIGGRVVTYCSLECKKGADATPLPAPLLEPEHEPEPENEHGLELEHGLDEEVIALEEQDSEPESDALDLPGRSDGDITPVPAPALIASFGARPRRARNSALAALAVVLAGGGALVLAVNRRPAAPAGRAVARAVPTEAPQRPPAPPAPVEVALDRAQLLARAESDLRHALTDPSARVRQLAATALSRTGDAAAIAELLRALDKDPSEIRRLEVAYALARAGQAHGTDYLVAALHSSRRDVRLEAARALALLKDPRGGARLREALGVTQLRLGAAENLAALGDEHALAILHQALSGRSRENRMRAAVALGRAGDAAGRELLEKIVDDGHLEIGAEDALARLGDRKAVPALQRALGLSAVRVRAAIGLRRLKAKVDLAVLARALDAGDQASRISAAEAALVLLLPDPPAELR